MTKRIIQSCDIIMEITWLLALVSIPIYFNIYTSRVFEPDKISLFRSLVLLMALAWLGKGLALLAVDWEATRATGNPGLKKRNRTEPTEIIYPEDGEVIGPDSRSFPASFIKRPLMPFVMVLVFMYIIATIFSVVPGVSWWGGYQRSQGTYTFLSYVIFFLVIVFNMRERRQLERLISFILLGNIPVALYGLLQHYKADPLQWQGDVVFRVTSTMGNAIFISAYLIMVLPLVAYRAMTTGQWLLQNRKQANKYFKGRQRDTALSWITLYAVFMFFLIGIFYVVLNFNSNYRPTSTPGIAQASDAVQLLGNESGAEQARHLIGNESVGPWWALPIGIVISFSLFFLFTVRRQGTDTNYLFRLFEFGGYLSLVVIVLLTIFYSQSRGPEAGLLVGMYVFFPIIFWRRKAWKWLLGWLGVGLVFGGLLLMFNLPPNSTPLEPVFKVARQNEQIARLGTFLAADDGTGKVRQLIWKTVLELMGDAAQHDPVHLIVGFGPESLYNKAPEHYQPELGQIEARNAIPDRSHNGYLDALETTGILGLIAYVALVLAFLYYAFKFLRRTERYEYQVLLAALIAIMVAHQLEIQTGIQIASTWTMFWASAGMLLVLGGLIYGRWDMVGSRKFAVAATPTEEDFLPEVPEVPVIPVGKNGKKAGKVVLEPVMASTNAAQNAPELSQNMSARNLKNNGSEAKNKSSSKPKERESAGITAARPSGPVVGVRPGRRVKGPVIANAFTEPEYAQIDRPVKGWFWLGLGLAAVVALAYAWLGNILPVLGDTVYKQGSNLAQVQQWVRATPYLEEAVILSPNEDFYSLYLGQAYLEIAQTQAADKTKLEYYLKKSEAELLRANKLAPLNPDHYANLARLYTRWAELEPPTASENFNRAVKYYQDAVLQYAPRNARLWAEYANVQSIMGTRSDVGGTSKDHMDKAIEAGLTSVKIDGNYDYNRLILGDIYRLNNQLDAAGAQFYTLARIAPHQLATDPLYTLRMQALASSHQVPPGQAINVFSDSGSNYQLTPAVTGLLDTLRFDPVKLQPPAERSFVYTNRGIIQYYQGNLEAARTSLMTAASPNDPYNHAYLSLVYKGQGQAVQAQNEAAQARSLVEQVQQNKQQVQAAIERLLAS